MRHTLFLALLLASPAVAQVADTDAITAERQAITRLDRFDGIWRGEAVIRGPGGEHRITQTERVGGFLDGTLKLIDGHGFNADGSSGFRAFGVISYDPATSSYAFRSHAQGRAGTFAMQVTDTGYIWTIPAGPATIRYTAKITGDTWNEVGDRVVPGATPQRFFEMNLKRVGDTDWPVAGAVKPN